MTSRWIICKDDDKHIAVEIFGRETKLLFLILEKDNKPLWRLVASCLKYRTRIAKNDPRLFETKHDAIDAKINELQAAREQHLKRSDRILEEIRQLREIR